MKRFILGYATGWVIGHYFSPLAPIAIGIMLLSIGLALKIRDTTW